MATAERVAREADQLAKERARKKRCETHRISGRCSPCCIDVFDEQASCVQQSIVDGERSEEGEKTIRDEKQPLPQLWSSFRALHPFGKHDRMGWARRYMIVVWAPQMQGGTRCDASKSPIGWGCNLTKFGPSQRSIKSKSLSSAQKAWRCSSRLACTGRSRELYLSGSEATRH